MGDSGRTLKLRGIFFHTYDTDDFRAKSTTFPATTFCRGTVYADSSDIIIEDRGPESYTADFSGGISSGHWRSGDMFPDSYST
jgi:hypothetical protein